MMANVRRRETSRSRSVVSVAESDTAPTATLYHSRAGTPAPRRVERPLRAAFSMIYRVIYEDLHMIAVDKPAGVVVPPTYKNPDGTLLDALRSADVPRPSIVGRLDKLTSGIVVVAKSAD